MLAERLDQPSASARRASDWIPDWRGHAVAIVASGPSVKSENLDLLRGRLKVVAIKENVNRLPFADAVYGCDDWWWKHRNGLPEFKGLKLAWGDRACAQYPDVKKIEIKDTHLDRLVFDRAGSVGSGGNSGFQALNFVAQCGADRILLVGFDMHVRNGLHWYGRNSWPRANNPSETNFTRWRAAFEVAAGQLAEMDVRVINASMSSDLKCFPQVPIAEALLAMHL